MFVARARASLTTVLLLAAVLCACDRADSRPPSNSAAAAGANGGGPLPSDGGTSAGGAQGSGGSSASTTPACLVPTPAEPPPTAEPAASCPADTLSTPPELERVFITFADAPGAPRISAEHAQTHAQRNRGLMFRTEMPRDDGMLFSWPDEAIRSFWMRNTCIPLDMLFIDGDGAIVGIVEQVPVLNDVGRSVRCPARYVLEVNAGWCRQNGVVAGQHVLIDE
jgi:uncharacterized membrane protein (UPF0127 family)